MTNAYITVTVNDNGTLSIPAFAVRGLGYQPGAAVSLALPTEICSAECEASALLIRRVCDDYSGEGYTTENNMINLPLELLEAADIETGSAISVLSSDGMMIIAVTSGDIQRDLTDELGCFMAELGYDPESVESRCGRHDEIYQL